MNDQNPYQSPTTTSFKSIVAELDWSTFPNERIDFSVHLDERDVKRLYSAGFQFRWFVLAIFLLIVLFLLGDTALLFLIVPLALIVLLLFLARWRLNWKQAIKQTPRLLKPVTGYICSNGLYSSSPGYHGYSRWDDIHLIRTTPSCLVVSGENWRLVSLLLPWESFSDGDSAEQAMESVVRQRKNFKPVTFGDQRLTREPVEEAIFAPIEPFVSYKGNVLFNQLTPTEPGKLMKRGIFRTLLVAFIFILVGLLVSFHSLTALLFMGLPAWLIAGLLIYMLVKHPILNSKSDKVALFSQGWFCEPGFFLQASTGQSYREWSSIDSCSFDDSMLCLRLPGAIDSWFFIARSQFHSAADFSQACSWAEQGLKEPDVTE